MGRGQQSVEETVIVGGEAFKRGRRRAGLDAVRFATPIQTSADVFQDTLFFFLNLGSFAPEHVPEQAVELQQRLRETRAMLRRHRISSARVWLESKIGFAHSSLANVIDHWPRPETRAGFIRRLAYEAKDFETKLIWWQIELEREANGDPPLDHGGF